MTSTKKHNRILVILMGILFLVYVPILLYMQPSIIWLAFALLATIPVYLGLKSKSMSTAPGFGCGGDLILVGGVLMLYAMYDYAYWNLLLIIIPLTDMVMQKTQTVSEEIIAEKHRSKWVSACSIFAILTLVSVAYAYVKLFKTGMTSNIFMAAAMIITLCGLFIQLKQSSKTHLLFIETMEALGTMFLCNMLIIHFDKAMLPYELAFFILYSGYTLCLMCIAAGHKKSLTQSVA